MQTVDCTFTVATVHPRDGISPCAARNTRLVLTFIHFQMEGEIEKDSEVQATYKDLHAKRPIIHKVIFLHSRLIFQVTYRFKGIALYKGHARFTTIPFMIR